MDLQNVELVLFRMRSEKLEESAEDPVARTRTQRLHARNDLRGARTLARTRD